MPWEELIFYAIIIAVISMIISKSSLFKELRVLLGNSIPGRLVKCPFCFAHWVAGFVCFYEDYYPSYLFLLVGLAVVPMTIVALFFAILERI